MHAYLVNIEERTLRNTYFREVLYTTQNSQLVVMHLEPREEIGTEVHHLDQFIRCEAGKGKAIIDDTEYAFTDGYAVVIPSGTKHNIINTSSTHPLKLYTIYTPPNHHDGTIHKTKIDAQQDELEHFDGKITDSN